MKGWGRGAMLKTLVQDMQDQFQLLNPRTEDLVMTQNVFSSLILMLLGGQVADLRWEWGDRAR